MITRYGIYRNILPQQHSVVIEYPD